VPSLVVITRPDSCHASAWDLNRLSSSSRPSRARTQISGRGRVASDAAVLVSRRSRRPARRCSCQAIRASRCRGRVRRAARISTARQRCAPHAPPARRGQTRHDPNLGASPHQHRHRRLSCDRDWFLSLMRPIFAVDKVRRVCWFGPTCLGLRRRPSARMLVGCGGRAHRGRPAKRSVGRCRGAR
jgi:hypothetical protein